MNLHSTITGTGKPLLILHGFLGMGDNWKSLARDFAGEGFEVHLIDQRNHGRSPHSDEFSYQLLAEDVKNYMEQKNIGKATIIGHSMGGKTLMKFLVTYPKKVNDAIVVDIAPKYYAPHHQQILAGLNHLNTMHLTSRSQAEDEMKKYISHPGILQFLLKNLYWEGKEKLALRMNLSGLEKNIDEIGKALGNGTFEEPVLFVAGSTSDYITSDDKALVRRHFPKAQIIAIKDAGHWVHAEKKEEFFTTCIAYLNR